MPSRTYNADVVATFIGKDKSLGRVTDELGRKTMTWRDKTKLAGRALTQVAQGDVKGAKKSFGELKVSMGDAALAAAGIATAVVAAIATAVAVVDKLIKKYIELGKQVGAVSRIVGTSGDESNALRVQFKMLGMDVDASAKALGKFGATVGTAMRTGKGNVFDELGVSLTDANGNARDNAEILADVRDRLSEVKKENINLYQSMAKDVFGKGWMTLDKWLSAAPAKIAKFNKIASESGVDWNDKGLSKYLEDSRETQVIWEDIQATIGQELMPILKDVLVPTLKEMTKNIRDISSSMDVIPGKAKLIGQLGRIAANPFRALWYIFRDIVLTLDKILDRLREISDIPLIPNFMPSAGATVPTQVQASTASQATTSAQSLAWLFSGVIPGFAKGGIVRKPTLAMVGERGPEAIIPLGKGGTGGSVHVHIGTLVGTDARAARQLSDMVGRHLMNGVMRGMVGQNG